MDKLISINLIVPHAKNPRLSPREDIIEQLAGHMASGFDPAHALIVRPLGNQYEVISGHHRLAAAKQVGLDEVPCFIRDMSDETAYMQLVLCNTQSELHPLEEGKHAAESGMDLKRYAEAAGKAATTLRYKLMAWRVISESHVRFDEITESWRNLAEIHASPKWLWSALVEKMLEDGWTVQKTREVVAWVKEVPTPPEWVNADELAKAILNKSVKPSVITKFGAETEDESGVFDADLREMLMNELHETKPFTLSGIQTIVQEYRKQQQQRDAEKKAEEIAKQKAEEEAAMRVARLRSNVSLDEWKELSEDEQRELLTPVGGEGSPFNKQENDSIEWAQWSWNPVTGCKHECSYCYARDIALSKRMEKVYPHGFEPCFRSNALNAPGITKVPKEAATDTRYKNVFTCSMADLFGRWVPAEWIIAVLDTVRNNPQWNFLFLTKFPKRMAEFDIPQNAWVGTTVDLQVRVKNAEDAFERVQCGVKWLSVEPMLEPLKFTRLDLFDWVVIGGASSSSKTPAWQPPFPWIADLVDQCRAAGTKVYFKTNLLGNRIIELPFDAAVKTDPTEAPEAFKYLG